MKPEALLRLYPRAWRERYGDEMLALVEQSGGGWRCTASLVSGAVREWVHAAAGDTWAGRVAAALAVVSAELMVAVSILLLFVVVCSAAGLAVQWTLHALSPEWRLPSAIATATTFADAWSHAMLLIGYGAIVSLPLALVGRRFFAGASRAACVLAACVCMALVVRALGGPFEIALGGGVVLWRMVYRAHLPTSFNARSAAA